MKPVSILSTLAMVLALCACGISRQTARQRQAEKARIAQQVQASLDECKYTIDIDYMIPLRGGGKPVSSYSLKVAGDTLDSHLPYIGEARTVPYGGGKGLNFQEKISQPVSVQTPVHLMQGEVHDADKVNLCL